MIGPNKNPKYERWRWQIFGITWLAYAGYYLTRKAFAVAKNELKKKFTKKLQWAILRDM